MAYRPTLSVTIAYDFSSWQYAIEIQFQFQYKAAALLLLLTERIAFLWLRSVQLRLLRCCNLKATDAALISDHTHAVTNDRMTGVGDEDGSRFLAEIGVGLVTWPCACAVHLDQVLGKSEAVVARSRFSAFMSQKRRQSCLSYAVIVYAWSIQNICIRPKFQMGPYWPEIKRKEKKRKKWKIRLGC